MNFSDYYKTYEWRVEVNDGIGNWINETYKFTTKKDLEPPTVSITQPLLGFIYIFFIYQWRLQILPATSTLIIGKIDIKVDATDNDGIKWVKFYINNTLRSTDFEPPYMWSWNELTIYDPYIIKVVASDYSGNTKSDEIQVWKFQLFVLVD